MRANLLAVSLLFLFSDCIGVTAEDPTVPVIDLGPWTASEMLPKNFSALQELTKEQLEVVEKIQKACRNVGFFMIENHGFNKTIVDDAWKASRDFFSLSSEEKMQHKTTNEKEYPYGYEQSETLANGKQLDGENGNRIHSTFDRDDDTAVPLQDLKETFSIGPNHLDSGMPPRRWILSPSVPRQFQSAVEAYYHQMEKLSLLLLEIFALALNEDRFFFHQHYDHHMSALRLAHYFPLQDPRNDSHLVRAGAHTDYGAFTILAAQDRGLEVLLEDEWAAVPIVDNTFVVNLGDLMQRWTNDRWLSTMHRVAMPSTDALEQRYSIAFFVNVNGDTVIQPLSSCLKNENANGSVNFKYPPITAGEHLMAKHLASMGEAIQHVVTSNSREEL